MRAAFASLASTLVMTASLGCNLNPPRIHPDYQSIKPTSVRVAEPENRTLIAGLRSYKTSGRLQTWWFSGKGGEVDVIEKFGEGASAALDAHGYSVRPAGAEADGELRLRLYRFDDTPRVRDRGIAVEFEVELVRLDSGISLYQRRLPYLIKARTSSGKPMSQLSLGHGIAAAVRAALGSLPPAGASSPDAGSGP